MHVFLCLHLNVAVCESQKKALDPLEMELQKPKVETKNSICF